MNFLNFFKTEYWLLKQYEKTTKLVLKSWKKIEKLNDIELKNKTEELTKKIKKNKNLDVVLHEAFAVVCETIKRIKKIKLHDTQITGGIVLYKGNVAEMKTGEGKTLTALLPIYLNVLFGNTVYIVTVNEYLVKRDKENNEEILNFLGVTSGFILSGMNEIEKKKNYKKNLIYSTNSELGFDYLRDNMKTSIEEKIQGKFSFIIIDEIDSILIDEAQTPLIISGRPKDRSFLYKEVDNFVKKLQHYDYVIDKELQKVFLNKRGIKKTENHFKLKNLYLFKNSELNHFLNNSLYANIILKKNIDYVVKKNKILLIDKFTGRIMEGRSLSEGLHQSLEAKENCEIKKETSVVASVTYQNFFRLFEKISGMTGTAWEEKDEFLEIYNMHVIKIPTNLPIIRKDLEDLIFFDKKHKYLKVIKDIEKYYEIGQPVLVGTNSVNISEEISLILRKLNIPHNVLNAKRHEYEASIIEEAGKYKTITIATNMAGRGTDIKLDDRSKKLGGLVLISLGRNDSRRIDLQLTGRSGRQGEPGISQFYLSLDDSLFTRFGGEKLKIIFSNNRESIITSKFLTRIIKKAQEKLHNMSFEQRKSLLEFDNIVAQQRRVVYRQRDFLMKKRDFTFYIYRIFNYYLNEELKQKMNNNIVVSKERLEEIFEEFKIKKMFLEDQKLSVHKNTFDLFELKEIFFKYFKKNWEWFTVTGEETAKIMISNFINSKILFYVDEYWTQHLDEIIRIKSSSFLHGYAQKRPLQKFIEETEELFEIFKKNVSKKSVEQIFVSLDFVYKSVMNKEKI